MTSENREIDISEELRRAFLEGEGPDISVGEIVTALGPRSFGLGIMVFLIPICVPMPPGIPMTIGAVLGVFAVQLLLGRENLWLPRSLSVKRFQRSTLRKAYGFAQKYLGWLFRLARPRGLIITGPVGRRLAGLVFLILGFLLILPIPVIGNVLPAISGTILALGLTDRDGLVFAVGFAASIVAIVANIFMAIGAWNFLDFVF